MTLTVDEVRRSLDRVTEQACTAFESGRMAPAKFEGALTALAHMECALFGYDPGCGPKCPYC